MFICIAYKKKPGDRHVPDGISVPCFQAYISPFSEEQMLPDIN